MGRRDVVSAEPLRQTPGGSDACAVADVVLVCMPFAEVQRPSIALGLLKAALAGTKIRSQVVYANFHFAEAVGIVAYQAIQSTPTDNLLGEWCFAQSLFPADASRDDEYSDPRCRSRR